MVLCLIIWWQRGFAEERKEEKDKEAAKDYLMQQKDDIIYDIIYIVCFIWYNLYQSNGGKIILVTGEANNYKSLVDQIQALDPNFGNDPNLKKSLLAYN